MGFLIFIVSLKFNVFALSFEDSCKRDFNKIMENFSLSDLFPSRDQTYKDNFLKLLEGLYKEELIMLNYLNNGIPPEESITQEYIEKLLHKTAQDISEAVTDFSATDLDFFIKMTYGNRPPYIFNGDKQQQQIINSAIQERLEKNEKIPLSLFLFYDTNNLNANLREEFIKNVSVYYPTTAFVKLFLDNRLVEHDGKALLEMMVKSGRRIDFASLIFVPSLNEQVVDKALLDILNYNYSNVENMILHIRNELELRIKNYKNVDERDRYIRSLGQIGKLEYRMLQLCLKYEKWIPPILLERIIDAPDDELFSAIVKYIATNYDREKIEKLINQFRGHAFAGSLKAALIERTSVRL